MQLRAGCRSCEERQGWARPTVAALGAPKRGKGAASFSGPPLLRRGQALKCVIRPDQAAIREFPGTQPEITAFTGKRGAQALRLEVQQLGKLLGCNTHFDELQSIRVGGMGMDFNEMGKDFKMWGGLWQFRGVTPDISPASCACGSQQREGRGRPHCPILNDSRPLFSPGNTRRACL